MFLSEQPRLGFIPSETRLFTLTCTDLDDDKIVEIPSKPPEPGSELSPSTIINLNNIDDIHEILHQAPGLSSYRSHSTDKDIEIYTDMLYNKISSCLLSALIEDHIKTCLGEKYGRIQGLEFYWDRSWGALQDTAFAWKDHTDTIQALTTWKDLAGTIRALTEFYQSNSKLPDTMLLRRRPEWSVTSQWGRLTHVVE